VTTVPLSEPTSNFHDAYRSSDANIFVPPWSVEHRDEEYSSAGFDVLLAMQERHFWYRGRHRFLLAATKRVLRAKHSPSRKRLAAVDLGGGCGGWIRYLQQHSPELFSELALADSSAKALQLAGEIVGPDVKRYHTDLLNLGWRDRWDVAFLLDVLEHVPDDAAVLGQIREALKPGGLLLVAAPALKFFWSYHDEIAHHVRRYSRGDFYRLAMASGLRLRSTRYFMFLLSPLLLASRGRFSRATAADSEDLRHCVEREHRVPPWAMNELLALTFAMETPAGLWCPFPWGTSVVAVLEKPRESKGSVGAQPSIAAS
jgi:SAM-dependent methyltransferase